MEPTYTTGPPVAGLALRGVAAPGGSPPAAVPASLAANSGLVSPPIDPSAPSAVPLGYGESGSASPSVRKSPSILGMSFFKDLGGASRKPSRPPEPKPQKRRGPKPDAKPAQTRRQELNRQAQRTHRERKEQYIRSLEVQISQLREGYANDISKANMTIFQLRQALEEAKEDNVTLRRLLSGNGIPFENELDQRRAALRATSQTGSSFPNSAPQSVVFSGRNIHSTDTSVSPRRSPVPYGLDAMETFPAGQVPPYHGGGPGYQPGAGYSSAGGKSAVGDAPGVFESDPQLGVDFILNLENPCREHMERLCRRAHDDEEQDTPAGHILMATCPPPSQIATAPRGQPYTFQTYDLPHPNLDTLLNLSKQLVTKDEITPIMALQAIKSHEMYPLLTREDVLRMMDDLVAKIRCYGFGAVLEEFEFMDSLSRVLAGKMEADYLRPFAAVEGMYS